MKAAISSALAISIVLSVALSSGLFSNTLAEKTLVYALTDEGDDVFTAELAHVPLLISNVKVDLSVKTNTYLNILCELRIGDNYFTFTLNDLSLGFHVEHGRAEIDGEVNEYGLASFKATVDTDGIIVGVPKLILYYITLA